MDKKAMKLTNNFWLSEFTKSNTATRLDIDNTPQQYQIDNLKYLCEEVLQPLRTWAKEPINISSGFRSKSLNRVLKGSTTSYHLYGMAADIDQDGKGTGIKNIDVFKWIQKHVPYTELIFEFPKKDGDASWIHVALDPIEEEPSKETLIAYKQDGRTIYREFSWELLDNIVNSLK